MTRPILFSYSVIIHDLNGFAAKAEGFGVIFPAKDEGFTLSVVECRKYLNGINLTDTQVEELRDSLCVLIDNVLDNYFDKSHKIKIDDYAGAITNK